MGHEPDADHFLEGLNPSRIHLFTTAGARSLYDTEFQKGDTLIFGSETQGLPDSWLERFPDRTTAIPIRAEHVRSLNLSVSVGVAVYEALRQSSATGQG